MMSKIVTAIVLTGAMFVFVGAASAQTDPPTAASCRERADCPKGGNDLWCDGYQVCHDSDGIVVSDGEIIPEDDPVGTCVSVVENNPCDNQGSRTECVELSSEDPAYLCTILCEDDSECEYGTCHPEGYCLPGECDEDTDCIDADLCDGDEICSDDGVCEEGIALVCDDYCDPGIGCIECVGNEDCDYGTCVEGFCIDGECDEDADCIDADLCDGDEICSSDGVCEEGIALVCDDYCDPGKGCIECVGNEDCDYGTCVEGVCIDGECDEDADCIDADLCDGDEICSSDGVCEEGAALVCDELCNPLLGCVECLTNEDCDFGTCSGEGECLPGGCSSDEDCDDDNICTGVETCTNDGECTEPDDLVCDDECNPLLGCVECLDDEDCDYGTCNPAGECEDGECSSDGDCDDNDICTGVETCTNDGVCTDPDDLVCDELCNPLLGCVECLTNEDCDFGTCSGEGICLPGGCSSDEDCDDDNICTGVETCTDEGECTEPDDLVCDDLCNPILGCVDCLEDDDCDYGTCNPAGECEDGECDGDNDCDDGDLCTGVETCTNDGVCTDPADLVCDEVCNPLLGCVECLTNEDCDFGTCSGEGICLEGGCGTDVDCDDNNYCTGAETCTNDGECTDPDDIVCDEFCDPILGCVECLEDEDCGPEGFSCDEGQCILEVLKTCGLKIWPKKMGLRRMFRRGERGFKIQGIKGEEGFDPFAQISFGEFQVQRTWVKMKKKRDLLRVKVRVPDETNINDIPKGPLTMSVGDCTGQVMIK